MNVATLADTLRCLDDYVNKYRKDNLPKLDVSGIYSLFPHLDDQSSLKIDYQWPDVWPHVDRQGI